MNWNTIRIWIAIILLLDAAMGLWKHDRFAELAPKVPVAKIAFIEAGIAIALLLIPLLFRR